MRVKITDAQTNLLVTEVLVNYRSLTEPTKSNDVINEAWRSAVEDKTVDPVKRKDYKFTILD